MTAVLCYIKTENQALVFLFFNFDSFAANNRSDESWYLPAGESKATTHVSERSSAHSDATSRYQNIKLDCKADQRPPLEKFQKQWPSMDPDWFLYSQI